MGNRIQKYKTYYAIPDVETGIASWNTYAQIKEWGKTNGYDSFVRNKKLFLIKEKQIIVYVMLPKKAMAEDFKNDYVFSSNKEGGKK